MQAENQEKKRFKLTKKLGQSNEVRYNNTAKSKTTKIFSLVLLLLLLLWVLMLLFCKS